MIILTTALLFTLLFIIGMFLFHRSDRDLDSHCNVMIIYMTAINYLAAIKIIEIIKWLE